MTMSDKISPAPPWTNPSSLEEIEAALDAGRLFVAIAGGKFLLARRNGQTKRKESSDYRIPIKVGFQGCDAITKHYTKEYLRIANSRREAESSQ